MPPAAVVVRLEGWPRDALALSKDSLDSRAVRIPLTDPQLVVDRAVDSCVLRVDSCPLRVESWLALATPAFGFMVKSMGIFGTSPRARPAVETDCVSRQEDRFSSSASFASSIRAPSDEVLDGARLVARLMAFASF